MISSAIFWVAGVIASASACPKCDFVLNRDSQKHAAANYINTWNGNFSLENNTFTPDVALYQDRLPGVNGSIKLPVSSSAEFIKFMRLAHTGWDHYGFVVHALAFDEYNLVIRWALNATVGPHDKMIIPVMKPEGTHITYNGTDWLYLDQCTGKIKQVDSAQDYITELYEEGVPGIKI